MFSTRTEYLNKSSRIVLLTAAIAMLFSSGSVFAEDTPVPEGFQRLPNGDIVVEDPTIAFPPSGYRISQQGVLMKTAEAENVESAGVTETTADPVNTENTDSSDAPEQTPVSEEAANADTDANKIDAKKEESNQNEITKIPPGFHRMPNGEIMANSPSKAVAPPGFRLTEGGILKKIGDVSDDTEAAVAAAATVDDFDGVIPPGYHRMPDGTLMANSPTKAVAPEGYHLMPDGTLMADGTSIDHSRHSHGGGGMWMAEYKFVRMYMDGLLDTTNDVSPTEVVDPGGAYGYDMSPTDMVMDMHMFMVMYHTTNYMVMVMAHYMSNDMGMLSEDGTQSTMKSSGLADTIVTFEAPWRYNLAYTLGISLPTGSIDEHGLMQHTATSQSDTKFPYGMQLGSGTYDLILGLGYEQSQGKLDWGADYEYTLRTGTNDNDYTLGDKSILKGWARWTFTNTVTAMGKLTFMEVGRIDGADPELIPSMSPTADADNYGGRRADLGLSVRYETPQMTSVGLEFTAPVYQNLFGPQMKTEWLLGLSFGFMF